MDDLKLLEAIEQYISGQMTPDERVYFEQLRKSNPEIDQMVVEHTFFMHQMNRYDATKKFRKTLSDIHIDLAEKRLIKSPKLKGKARVIYLINRYKRVAAIAASIAGITTLAISALVWSLSPAKPAKEDLQQLKRDINVLKNQNKQLDKEIDRVKQIQNVPPAITYKTGGTGFLIDPKGYMVTDAHVIENAKNVAVQNNSGRDFPVEVIYVDRKRDLAILKIADTSFKTSSVLPYSIKHSSPDISEPIYTLGYPRNEIVYGEGYLAAKTGYNGDTLTCQVGIAANPGNSGGPVINRNGEIIGILSTKQITAEGVVFATLAKYIYNTLKELQKQEPDKRIKIPSTSSLKGLDRTQQVKKIADYVFMVKVS
ncbi:MAG: trypsin-like peptidase domain-containing protein [Chitinophagaceae bacterium]|nr:trypsin-like peptidase domain-containing protein [Chitinophagaceae bacterium]